MAILASDTFTRADAATLGTPDVGGAYSVVGSWRVVSNKGARASGATTTNTALISGVGSNIDASVDITSFGINDGLIVRASDASNYLLVSLDSAGLNLWKNVAGTFTKLDNFTFTITSGTTYTVRVVLIGSAYQVYLSGTLRLSGTLTGTAATLSGTAVGYRSAGAANNSTYDNLLVGNAVTATGTSSITLTGSGTGAAAASTTASLTLSGSGTAAASPTATASLTLSGAGTTTAPATASASLNLTGAGTATAPTAASAQLSLTGQGAGSADTTSGASITLTAQGSGAAPSTSTASLTFTGGSDVYASTGGTASITLTGAGTAVGRPRRDVQLTVGAPFTSWTAAQPFHGWTADAPTAGEWTAGAPETGWTAGAPATEAWTTGPVRI